MIDPLRREIGYSESQALVRRTVSVPGSVDGTSSVGAGKTEGLLWLLWS